MDPDVQASVLESLEPERAAEIIEEMSPDEAADALSELEEETSHDIMEEMDPESKTEVRELIEYEEDTAGGMMNTEYVALSQTVTVGGAMQELRANEELLENLTTIFLTDARDRLVASVPLARLFLAPENNLLKDLASDSLIKVGAEEKQDRVTELFDKYNLLALPVIDSEGRIEGVITADDIITVLRQR
jgi:Mg/Co/Ni transporter MgtE